MSDIDALQQYKMHRQSRPLNIGCLSLCLLEFVRCGNVYDTVIVYANNPLDVVSLCLQKVQEIQEIA